MECRHFEHLIEQFWDRELDEPTARGVEDHLASCRACNARYGAVSTLLTRREEVAVPSGLRDRILNAIEANACGAERRPASAERGIPSALPSPWIGALAACITLAFVGLLAWQTGVAWRPQNAGPAAPVVRHEPSAPVLATMAQALVIPVPFGPLPVFAQAATLHQAVQPPQQIVETPRRRFTNTPPRAEQTPGLQELSVLLANWSLGA